MELTGHWLLTWKETLATLEVDLSEKMGGSASPAMERRLVSLVVASVVREFSASLVVTDLMNHLYSKFFVQDV